jgi:hypothetical protein
MFAKMISTITFANVVHGLVLKLHFVKQMTRRVLSDSFEALPRGIIYYLNPSSIPFPETRRKGAKLDNKIMAGQDIL